MPRSPRMRPGDGDASPSPARRAWLSQFKEVAVQQLPPTASPAVRAKLRLNVEHALRRHGPDDPALELQDILATLVAEARAQLDENERQTQQAGRKEELIAFARSALVVVLNECPTYLVGAPGSGNRMQTTRAVWADLRLILEKTLSGAESERDVRQRVEEHIARWRSEHDRWWRPRVPSPQSVIKGIGTAKAIVDVVNQTPELRQLADTVTQAVLAQLRTRRSPKEPPTAPS
jgi:hypothetical protein